jgi:hypothetical protein
MAVIARQRPKLHGHGHRLLLAADSCHRLRLWQWADTRQKGSPVASGAEKSINT